MTHEGTVTERGIIWGLVADPEPDPAPEKPEPKRPTRKVTK